MAKKTKVDVERSVTFDTEVPHPLVESMKAEDEEELPELTSVGVYKVPGRPYYVSFVMKSRGTVVTKVFVEEPNIRQVAEESAKISFVKEFMDNEHK